MARKVSISVSIDYDMISRIGAISSNRSKFIIDSINLRLSELKLEDVLVIRRHLESNPDKIGTVIEYVNTLKRMLEDL